MNRRPPLSKVALAVLSVMSFPSVLLYPHSATAVVLEPYNPVDNDQLAGRVTANGTTLDLTGVQRFQTGVDGAVNTTLGDLLNKN